MLLFLSAYLARQRGHQIQFVIVSPNMLGILSISGTSDSGRMGNFEAKVFMAVGSTSLTKYFWREKDQEVYKSTKMTKI